MGRFDGGCQPAWAILLSKGETFFHTIDHCLVDLTGFSKPAFALRTFRRGEMAQPGLAAQYFAGAGDFKPFRNGFLGFTTCDSLGHGAGKLATGY